MIKKLEWLIFAVVVVAVLEFLSLSGIRLPKEFAFVFFAALILLIGWQTILKGFKALGSLKFSSINLLMLMAVIGAFYLGEYEEAAVVVVLFTLAEKLEDFGIAKSKSSLDLLLENMPKYAFILGEDEPLRVSYINIGDIIVVKPHAFIPLDGEVVGGESFVDESSITGEPIAKDKRKSDLVFAGSMNKNGVLEIRVTKKSADSTLAKIREMTFDAIKHRAETQKFIEKFSSYYTPSVLLLALSWLFWESFIMGYPFDLILPQSLSLLVISCPCALVISTPISVYSAIGASSLAGILIKGGKYLEAMGKLKAIAFDKTRTLTYGNPIVTDVIPLGSLTREELLSCSAGVEIFSEHPLAKSVVDKAKEENLPIHKTRGFESIVGKGAIAHCLVCDDKKHTIGKLEFILEEHSVPKKIEKLIETLQESGKTVVVIATHGQIEGVIAIEDEIREESKEVVSTLKNMGIAPFILSGDNDITTKAVGETVGIGKLYAHLLPQDKDAIVEKLISEYKFVAMVGDGVNDAPALAKANVGISMSKLGSDTALEAASIVILNDHLNMIPYLVRLGRKTLNIIKFNTIFAILVKLFFIILALLGQSRLALAILADVGVTIMVILNSLRLLKFKL